MTEKIIHSPRKGNEEYVTIDGVIYWNTAYVEHPEDIDLGGDIDLEEAEEMAKRGENLDKLLYYEKGDYARIELAKQGCRLDLLINDEYVCVREAVAEQGYGLDILLHDEDEIVRAAVARQGYGLDELWDDQDPSVRIVVARQGYEPEKMIQDFNENVRCAALKFIDDDDILDQLEKDESEKVRMTMLKLHPERLDHFKDDKYFEIRRKVAKNTQDLNILLGYMNEKRIKRYNYEEVYEDVVDVAIDRIQHDFSGFAQFKK